MRNRDVVDHSTTKGHKAQHWSMECCECQYHRLAAVAALRRSYCVVAKLQMTLNVAVWQFAEVVVLAVAQVRTASSCCSLARRILEVVVALRRRYSAGIANRPRRSC